MGKLVNSWGTMNHGWIFTCRDDEKIAATGGILGAVKGLILQPRQDLGQLKARTILLRKEFELESQRVKREAQEEIHGLPCRDWNNKERPEGVTKS